jgi:dephospho-CoA kinase
MLIVGLTGSIGMGKSTVAARLRELDIPVIDADAEVHALYAGAAVGPIEAAFPGSTRAGVVDRALLAAALMAEPAGFSRLESIVHPLVRAAERAKLLIAARQGAAIAVLEVPLLFETGSDARVDVTVVVSAPADVQRERVLARPGTTVEKFEQILGRQLPDAEKRQRADYVIDTGRPLLTTLAQIDAVVITLRGRRGTAYATYWS